jgi:hypothetical protein
MKAVLNSLEEVAEALRSEYEARDGRFFLKLDGEYPPLVEANTKLAEFRDNNRTLNATVTQLRTDLKKFDGIDPVEVPKMKARVAELEQSGVKNQGDVAELIKSAVKAAVSPLEQKLQEREASEATAREALAKTGLENKLREAGVKAGIDERAMPDYINRGLKVFKLIDGEPAARKGENPIFSKTRPAEELSMEEWAKDLHTEAPFLFRPSSGGGAGHGRGPGVDRTSPVRQISSDPLEFGRNLEGIAKGEVQVVQ